jgi:hypothetical protein
MTAHIAAFRSKQQRETEVRLLEQYKKIGIASIAAAAAAVRAHQPRKPMLATRPRLQTAD